MRYTKNDLGRISQQNGKQIKWWYFIPALIWIGLIIQMSIVPQSSLSRFRFLTFDHADKVVHFGVYFILAVTLLFGILGIVPIHRKHVFWTVVFCTVLGLGLEVVQGLGGANRHFEMLDIIANFLGALIGSALFKHFYKKLTDGRT